MLIAGAALGLVQTAVSALQPGAASSQPSTQADPTATGKPGGHAHARMRQPLSDGLQAALNQASPGQRTASVGQALKAYAAAG